MDGPKGTIHFKETLPEKVGILLGLKKSGKPIANNKIDK